MIEKKDGVQSNTNQQPQAEAVMEPMDLKHEAYARATKVDMLINQALADYPPEVNVNADYFWPAFIRTIETTLHIVAKMQYRPSTPKEDASE